MQIGPSPCEWVAFMASADSDFCLQRVQRFDEGRAGDAAFGDYSGDVAGGGDVEGGVGGVYWRGQIDAGHVRDFFGAALLDGNLIAGVNGEIERGDRGGDVERNVVFFGQDGDAVGADFVGGVAVGGDAVGANYDGAYVSGAQEVADHVVGDQGQRDLVLMQFPCGEAGALQVGAGLRHQNFERGAVLDGN